MDACRAAMRDGPFLHPGTETALIRPHLDLVHRGEALPRKPITGREEEVLGLVAEGRSSKEIAGLLVTSVRTVERHRAGLPQKLGARDRDQLTR
ncbi:response regulator transcription factor [Streptomyces termitum]|uniref:response regulator transcription factor n=1 Tax=Streptomyces termitum TaxID=67368 RepID=UPI0037A325C9